MRRQLLGQAVAVGLAVVLVGSEVGAKCVGVDRRAYTPGSTAEFGITLDDASGVASLALTVNYDPALLHIISATNRPGTLGANFAMQSSGGDGRVRLVLSRDEALAAGRGVLATLVFTVNPGAQPGDESVLTIAKFRISGVYGANTAWSETVAASNGQFLAVASVDADSDGNGLPDSWELEHFGALTGTDPAADPDHDGSSNLAECRAGTDPMNGYDCLRVSGLAGVLSGTDVVLRWQSVTGRFYRVDRTFDLIAGFAPRATNLPATPPENVYTDDTSEVDGVLFYRIGVE